MINNNEKISLEVEILTQQINVFEDKIKQLEAKLNKFQSQKRKVKIEADIKDAENELSKLQILINKLGISEKNLQTYKKFSEVLSGLAVKIKDMGKEFIDEALNIKGYETVTIRLSESTEKGKKTIDLINKLAVSSQEFSLESLYVAGKHLANFKLDVEKLLPLISDFSDVFGADVDKASLIFSKALVGTRGGLTSLMTNFGITREELRRFGAEFTNQGVIVPQSIKSIEATMKLLVEYSKKAGKQGEDSAEQFENAVAKYNNSIQLTKIAIGKELLPVVSSLLEKIAELTLKFSEMSIEQKKTIANITLLAGGAVLTGQAITSLIPVINGLKIAYTALSTAIIANPISAIAIGIGAVIYSLEEWYKEQQKLKQARIEEDLKPVNNELRNMKDLIEDINKNSLKVNIKTSSEDIARAKEEIRSLAVSQYGDETFYLNTLNKDKGSIDIRTSWRKFVRIDSGEKLEDVYNKVIPIIDKINEKKKNSIELTEYEIEAEKDCNNILYMIDSQLSGINANYDRGNKALDDTKKKIEALSPALQNLSSLVEKAFSGLNTGLNAVADKLNNKEGNKEGEKPVFTAGDKNTDDQRLQALQKKFNYHKDMQKADKETQSQYLQWLNEFKGKYKFTNEELLQIDVEIQTAKDKINTYNKKQAEQAIKEKEEAIKKEEADFKTEYNIFKKSLDEKLKYGKITSDEYIKQTLKFAKDHQKFITPELGDEMNLRNQDVYDKHNEELLKAKEEEGKKIEQTRKKEEEALQKKRNATLAIEEEIARNNADYNEQIRLNEKKTIENFIKNEQDKINTFQANLNKKIEMYQSAGVDEVNIDRLVVSEKKKIQAEVLEDFRNKEKEKQAELQDTFDKIKTVNEELEKLYKERDELKNKGSFSNTTFFKNVNDAFDKHVDSYQDKFEQEKELDEKIKNKEDEKSLLQTAEQKASLELTVIKNSEKIATEGVITSLQAFSEALNSSSGTSGTSDTGGTGGDGGTNTGTEDEQGFQNTYSGTMNSIEASSGDSYNSIIAGGDTKNNPANKQIGKPLYYGNLPQNKNVEDVGNIPQNYSAEKGSWSIKNLSSDKQSSLNTMFDFLTGIAGNMKDINNSITNNKIMNSVDNSRITNNRSNININIDNKSQNITNPEIKRRINDFISLTLAGKTVR